MVSQNNIPGDFIFLQPWLTIFVNHFSYNKEFTQQESTHWYQTLTKKVEV